jgi:Na+-transporting methylmalonyl-CoA/oxaloacetate decarboxylase gamma subunit
MLQGFWGGVILSAVNQTIVFLVLGGLAGAILIVRKLVERSEARARRRQPDPPKPVPVSPPSGPPTAGTPRSQARVAAVVAAVHAAASAAPGTLRIVGITRLGAESPWRAAGRLEALGTELEHGQRRH